MVTPEQLRERPTVIRLRLGGNQQRLTWLVNQESEQAKLAEMGGKDCVEHMLTNPLIVQTDADREYVATIREFIEQEGKGYYSIGTTGMGTMVCAVGSYPDGIPKIHEDYRDRPITEVLIDHKTEDNQKIWYQELRIIKMKFVC